MRNRRGLVMFLATVSIIGLYTAPIFAQSQGDLPEDEPEVSQTPVAQKKPAKIPFAPCYLYAKGMFLSGSFSGSFASDQFDRSGLVLGDGCKYQNHRSRLSLVVGAEFYYGSFGLQHRQFGVFNGSFSYRETGVKGLGRIELALHPVTLGFGVGVQRTSGDQFKVNSLEANFGGTVFDLTGVGGQHMQSEGVLNTLEIGADATFLLRNKLSLTFGWLVQRIDVSASINIDPEGKTLLQALNVDADNIEKRFNQKPIIFFLTPGAKWCGKRWCVSSSIDYGVFTTKAWAYGGKLEVGLKF